MILAYMIIIILTEIFVGFLSSTSLWWGISFEAEIGIYLWKTVRSRLCTVAKLTLPDRACAGTGEQEDYWLLHYSTSSFHLFFILPPHSPAWSLTQPLPNRFLCFRLFLNCEVWLVPFSSVSLILFFLHLSWLSCLLCLSHFFAALCKKNRPS